MTNINGNVTLGPAQSPLSSATNIADAGWRHQLDDLTTQMTCLQAADTVDTVRFAVPVPAHVKVAEIFVLPIDRVF